MLKTKGIVLLVVVSIIGYVLFNLPTYNFSTPALDDAEEELPEHEALRIQQHVQQEQHSSTTTQKRGSTTAQDASTVPTKTETQGNPTQQSETDQSTTTDNAHVANEVTGLLYDPNAPKRGVVTNYDLSAHGVAAIPDMVFSLSAKRTDKQLKVLKEIMYKNYREYLDNPANVTTFPERITDGVPCLPFPRLTSDARLPTFAVDAPLQDVVTAVRVQGVALIKNVFSQDQIVSLVNWTDSLLPKGKIVHTEVKKSYDRISARQRFYMDKMQMINSHPPLVRLLVGVLGHRYNLTHFLLSRNQFLDYCHSDYPIAPLYDKEVVGEGPGFPMLKWLAYLQDHRDFPSIGVYPGSHADGGVPRIKASKGQHSRLAYEMTMRYGDKIAVRQEPGDVLLHDSRLVHCALCYPTKKRLVVQQTFHAKEMQEVQHVQNVKKDPLTTLMVDCMKHFNWDTKDVVPDVEKVT